MDELIKAVLDRIDTELRRYYWNANQKQMESPFANTGNSYSNDFFTVTAYSWNDDCDNEPNFKSEFLQCWWYKHAHRGLEYRIYFGEGDKLGQLAKFLNDCIKSIREDFDVRRD